LFAPKVSDAQLQQALSEAQIAVSLAPKDEGSQEALGDILMKLNRKDEARAAYQRALNLAETIYPEFQDQSIAGLKQKLR
jgi:Flp pilus assembly protein TadD